MKTASSTVDADAPQLARRLGLFDATMIVMGGIIGSGIFINAYVVARQVHPASLVLGAWAMGGLIALAGAFIYAELAAHRPQVGGQYAYIREALHPLPAFLYGWTLLLVTQTGGMAAVAVTFAKYFSQLTNLPDTDQTSAVIAVVTLALLTVINCLGVRAGSTVQSVLMVLKIVAILALIACGLFVARPSEFPAEIAYTDDWRPAAGYFTPGADWRTLAAFGAALVPVMFAYGGWQTSCFIAGEVREPRKNLPRGLLIGVLGVIALYMLANYVYVHVLGVDLLTQTKTPASEVMRLAFGERGKAFIAAGIAISTLGFLSQGMLTAPRVYFAMADDGLFFKRVAWLDARTRVPVVAIALQGVLAIVIIVALSGIYAKILNYVMSVDTVFFALSAACLFVFRRSDRRADFRVPWHPLTTLVFIIAESFVALSVVINYPLDSLKGWAILLAGIPIYFLWRRKSDEHH
ncbi:MAG TPA: APC family permease [Blastocatellia bacterium]|nr:APC family permease [Blastocatellia bacterium]